MRPVHRRRTLLRTLIAAVVVSAVVAMAGGTASAAQAPVGLGAANDFAVLAGSGITNTGPTTITGDVGTFPTTTETGFGSVTLHGTNHHGDAVTQDAKTDLVTAYGDAAGRGPATTVATELAGQTLAPGVYNSAAGTFQNSGTLTLDGKHQTNPVFIFQTASTLVTSSASSVRLINGANACHVYWKVGSSATLGTSSTFRGTILALTSITVTTGAKLFGRALARNGAVTLDTNTITQACTTSTTTTTTASTTTTTTASTTTTTKVTSSTNPSTAGQPVTFTATVTAANASTPTGSVEFFDNGASLGTVALDSAGHATLTSSALGSGNHSITAVYSGASRFSSSTSAALTQTINAAAATPIVATPRLTG